jgi:hypothetical protein
MCARADFMAVGGLSVKLRMRPKWRQADGSIQREGKKMKVEFVATILLLAAGTLQIPSLLAQKTDDLRKQADEIRAAADQLFKLRKIPWVTDPAAGFRLAKEENRPVFLYIQAGDPLEDC